MSESLKDKIRFFAGVMLLTYETAVEKADRPWLIVAALGLMGYSQIGRLADTLKK